MSEAFSEVLSVTRLSFCMVCMLLQRAFVGYAVTITQLNKSANTMDFFSLFENFKKYWGTFNNNRAEQLRTILLFCYEVCTYDLLLCASLKCLTCAVSHVAS